MDVVSGEDKAYQSLKLSELERVGTLGMGGFGRVELVMTGFVVVIFGSVMYFC